MPCDYHIQQHNGMLSNDAREQAYDSAPLPGQCRGRALGILHPEGQAAE